MQDATLVLLGTSHRLQCGAPQVAPAAVALFRTEVERICDEFAIKRIAEEMHGPGLRRHGVSRTVAQGIARRRKLAHRSIDLAPRLRATLSLDDSVMLGIAFGEYGVQAARFRDAFGVLWSDVRERAWLGRLLAGSEWPTLFVCGADHTDSVERLWRSLELPITVKHRDYEP